MFRFTILPLTVLPALAQDASLSLSRIREDVKYLSSGLLEGRGIPQGDALAT
jgi:hypothetical protein